MTVNELLRAAKSLIERQGHCKCGYIDHSGALCPSGALMAAQLKGGEPVSYEELRRVVNDYPHTLSNSLFQIEANELRRQAARAMGFNPWGAMVVANDLGNTTKEDVLGWFDRGIKATDERV